MLLRAWISLCAGLVALGWILSSFGGLTSLAYESALGLFVLFWLFYGKRIPKRYFKRERFLLRRLTSLRLLLPGIFVMSTLLLLLKGVMVPPCHDDGLCYRIPRAMNWIMDHRWHWISSEDFRLDVCGTVSEWLSVPILLLFKTDRLVFFPNWICHLFLPGLIFSVWRNLGVSSKIAWLAMWLLPSGFCFALQAVNTSNDSLGAFFILAAFFFALKGSPSKNWGDFAFSILCMALATGVKLNLLSLGLAWLIAMSAGWKTLLSRPALTTGALLGATLVSFVPTGFFNWWHGRGWTGLDYVPQTPPLVNFVCTTFRILAHNLMPPFFNCFDWVHALIHGIRNSLLGDLLNQRSLDIEPIFYIWIAIEQVGIGFIVLIGLILIFCITQPKQISLKSDITGTILSKQNLILICLAVAFLHYLFFIGSDQPARLICPFYLLLTPIFFTGRALRKSVSWRACKLMTGMAMFAGLYMALFFTENPLYGFIPFFEVRSHWDERLKQEVAKVIPVDENTIGVVRFYNQRETWLWQPYGKRKIIEFSINPDPLRIKKFGVHYIVISKEMLVLNHLTIESWLATQPVTLVDSILASKDDHWYSWYIVEIHR